MHNKILLFYKYFLMLRARRFVLRILSECRSRLDTIFGYTLVYLDDKVFQSFDKPKLVIKCLPEISLSPIASANKLLPTHISLRFLNQTLSLSLPITDWQNIHTSRLWRFNLHYFDWAHVWLDEALIAGKCTTDTETAWHLLDNWIMYNLPGKGDAWHSYTVSLRIRNILYLFLFENSKITYARKQSLWHQFIWLSNRLEISQCGNHLLENLLSLIICSHFFENKKSLVIKRKAISMLEKELSLQILPDGGLDERTCSYHFIILDRLVEAATFMAFNEAMIPVYLIRSIKKMTSWGKDVIKYGDTLPIFNDSSGISLQKAKNILLFADSLLMSSVDSKLKDISPSRFYMLNRAFPTASHSSGSFDQTCDDEFIMTKVLENTGWYLMKIMKQVNVHYKFGNPTSNRSPGHAHSDSMSINIYSNNHPILVSSGTHSYESSRERQYERSGSSHNVLRVSPLSQQSSQLCQKWIDSLTFGSFGTITDKNAKRSYHENKLKKNLSSLLLKST